MLNTRSACLSHANVTGRGRSVVSVVVIVLKGGPFEDESAIIKLDPSEVGLLMNKVMVVLAVVKLVTKMNPENLATT